MRKHKIVQEETSKTIADVFDSYEEAIAQIEEIKDICYDNEIFYINTRNKEFFKPYDLLCYKDYRKSKINGFILYHRGELPPRLIDLIKVVEKKNEK